MTSITTTPTEFLRHFAFGKGHVIFSIGRLTNWQFVSVEDLLDPTTTFELPASDVYFGPAVRSQQSAVATDVVGSMAFWIDADDPIKPQYTMVPSMQVFSGHGWHLYWLLEDPVIGVDAIEHTNKLLIDDVPTSDKATWNANRVLRVPGTVNNKNPDYPVNVELRVMNTLRYNLSDFSILESLSKQTRHKIRTGDSRGYRSRSERDWAIIVDLIVAGASDELITKIFLNQPCGDKCTENDFYLQQTIDNARTSDAVKPARPRGRPRAGGQAKVEAFKLLEEREDGYYVATNRGDRRVSTFVLDPTLLLDGMDGSEDALVCNVKASNYNWMDQTFPKSAFSGLVRMDKACPVAAWQWTGKDEDVRNLLPYLMAKLQEKGLPRVSATALMGLHKIKDKYYFIGDSTVLSSDDCWSGYTGPIAWLPTHKEHPTLDITPIEPSTETLDFIRKSIPVLNEPEVIYPMLGWYMASPLKTWIEAQGYRFPILHVVGTRGSGKTTLIQRVFLPLLGHKEPKSYDAGTTRFVTLALMGSSNGIPIAFSEFRYDSVERFIRIILLAYDTGHDPRGRGDQTTVDYPLSAPFSIDGEDLIDDPAARERIVVCQLHPETISEGSDSWSTFRSFGRKIPQGVGGYYVQRVLQELQAGRLTGLLEQARNEVFETFPMKLPDRVRNNHVIVHFGLLLWCKIMGMEVPNSIYLKRSITTLYNTDTGKSRTLADSLIEDVANAAAQATQAFKWITAEEGKRLYFQLASAHAWWLAARKRQGRGALERDAIRTQLKEAQYVQGPSIINGTIMYGIDLPMAQELGLDLPNAIKQRSITVNF